MFSKKEQKSYVEGLEAKISQYRQKLKNRVNLEDTGKEETVEIEGEDAKLLMEEGIVRE